MRNGMKVLISLLFVAIAGLLITTTVIKMWQVSTPASKGDVVMFEKPRGIVPGTTFRVMEVLSNGNALAMGCEEDNGNCIPEVLFIGDKSMPYYDGQMISVPNGKVAKQMGTLRYGSRNNVKTVPIVKIMAK